MTLLIEFGLKTSNNFLQMILEIYNTSLVLLSVPILTMKKHVEMLYMNEKEIDFTDDSEWRPEEMEEELKNSLFLLFDLKIIIENERKKYRYVSYEYVKLDIRKEMRKRMIEQEIKWGKEKERETTLESISSNFSTTTMYKLQ